MSSEIELEKGDVVERYTVEGPIGKGGVASVYQVRHNALGSTHAMKVLRVNADTMRERLEQEGQLQASLRHPNVVAVTDVVHYKGNPALVMDYIRGPSLRRWLQKNQPELDVAEEIFRGILAGVARAHRHGMVHRDLKPGNVLMATNDEGKLIPKVADFGLAKMVSTGHSDSSLTRTGTAMGTPAYMAPEQVRDSSSVDQRADIFALGCILYELCTGVSPFDHPDVFVVFNALASGSYAPPESLEPALPPRLNNAITGCLAVDPDRRIDSCSMLLQVLDGKVTEGWATSPSIDKEPPSEQDTVASLHSERPASTSPRRTRTGLRIMAGGTLAMGGVGLMVLALAVLVAAGFAWMRLREGPIEIVHDPGEHAAEAPAPAEPTPPEPATPPPDGGTPDGEEGQPEAGSPEPNPEAPSPAPPTAPKTAPTTGTPAPPAPAPPTPEPQASGPTGTVTATGEAGEVWLQGASGRVELGEVPVGEYRVHASFKGEAPMPAGPVTVGEGQTVNLVCFADFQMCRPK